MSDAPQDDLTIDGYQFVSTIAVGGTSEVREVIEPGTSRRLAMKLLNPKHPDFAEHKAGLRNEAKVLKLLDHPCIVHYEAFTAGRDHTYMLMEYFRAPNVKIQLKSNRAGVHVRLRKMLESVCSALQHVHEKGWIHRDIKPDNVLMNKVGEVKLIDFSLSVKQQGGLAKLVGGKVQTIQGTRTYLAPETIRKKPATIQTDLYSLGVMIFEILTGKTPFQAPSPDELLQKHLTSKPPAPSEFNPNVTPEMDRLVLKLLSKKPEQRGKDIGEIAGELRRIKIFKEEPQEERSEELSTDQGSPDFMKQLQDAKLDSRLDAKRSEMIKQNPELARQISEMEEARKREAEAKKARRIAAVSKKGGAGAAAPVAAPQAYPPQAMPPGMAPMMPPPGAPPYGMPGMPYAMPPAGYPGMPPGYPPGMLPGMMPPGAMMPGMPMPPMPPGAPPIPMAPVAPALPAQPVPAAPAAAPVATTPAAPPPKPSDDDLEYMTELPEVI